MLALTSLLYGAVVSFSGSTVDALAKSMADSMNTNSIIVTSQPHVLNKKFSFDTSSADSISTSVRTATGLAMAPGEAPLFSDMGYVASHFQSLISGPAQPEAPTTKMLAKYISGGTVTFSTNGATPIELGSMVAMPWSRPLKVDYLLKDLAVSGTVNKMPERQFLSSVAKASGAILTTDDFGYHLQYDAEQLRQRVVSTLQKVTPNKPAQVVDLKRDFYVAAVNALDGDTLVAIFQDPTVTPRLNVLPNTDLANAAIAYIKALEELSTEAQSEAQVTDGGVIARPNRSNQNQAKGDILSRVDNRAVVHLRLNATGQIILSVPVRNGRSSSYIDL